MTASEAILPLAETACNRFIQTSCLIVLAFISHVCEKKLIPGILKLFSAVRQSLAHIVGPLTARQRYAIKWRIAGGPLVARCCVLAGRELNLASTIRLN